MHVNKSAFKSELAFVQSWLSQFDAMASVLRRDTYEEAHEDDMHDLVQYLNGWARSNSKSIEPQTSQEMAVNNVMRVGIVSCILLLNEHLSSLLRDRLDLLKEQEKHYWTLGHRPPNYYARTIALRLAKLYARETGEFPTIGTTPESDAPSTAYGRALEETFRILSIEQDFRGPGEWAISQLNDTDLEPRNYQDPLKTLKELAPSGYLKKVAKLSP